jgi:hypothetical protein
VCNALRADLDSNDRSVVDAYRSARQQAIQAIADLCFQREMVGLFDHAWVYRIYAAPPDI